MESAVPHWLLSYSDVILHLEHLSCTTVPPWMEARGREGGREGRGREGGREGRGREGGRGEEGREGGREGGGREGGGREGRSEYMYVNH